MQAKRKNLIIFIALVIALFSLVAINVYADELSQTTIEKLMSQARTETEANNLDKALVILNRIIKAKPSDIDTLLLRSYVYRQKKDSRRAEADFRKIIKLQPDNSDVHGNLGWLLIEEGRFAEAWQFCKEAHKLDPYRLPWTINLGHLYLLTGDTAEAREYYRKALRQLSSEKELKDGPVADFELFIKNGWKVEECKKQLEWVKEEAKPILNAITLNDKVMQLYKEGKYDEATTTAKKALRMIEEVMGPEHPNVAMSLNNLAFMYAKTSRYTEAEPLHKRALAISEKALGPEHPDVATNLDNLALLYLDMGRYTEAEPLFKRALIIAEKQGPENTNVARIINNLASLYQETGKYAEAESLQKRAIAITEKTQGPEHPDFATSLSNLAETYGKMGRYFEAESLLKRALAISEKTLGLEHPDLIIQINNLALLYSIMSRCSEAEPLNKRALAISERTLGPEHPKVATNLDSLALLYIKMGRYEEAEPLCKRALAISEKVLGPEHPHVAVSLHNLAALYDITGRYAEAESLQKRAIAITEKTQGAEHPYVATNLNSLALLYINMGRYAEAESLLKRALVISEKALGPEHSAIAGRLNNLAGLYETTGRYAEAASLHKRALAISERTLGPEHPKVATSLSNFAVVLLEMGRYAEAEPLFKRALAISERTLGPEHPQVALSFNNLAELYEKTGQYAEAEPLHKRALVINEKALGPEHTRVAVSLNNLAVLYATCGRYAEAEPLHKRALAISERTLGPEHPDMANRLNNLGQLYSSMGRYAEAEPLLKRALVIAQKSGEPKILYIIQGNLSSILEKKHHTEAAIFFGKQAVNTIQALRTNVSLLGKETLKTYSETIEEYYKTLADLLIAKGRLAEAQQVLAMLKEEEYFQYIRRDAKQTDKLESRVEFSAVERPWQREYEKLSADNVRLGKEIGELREKAKREALTRAEKERLAELTNREKIQIAAFNGFIERLLKSLRDDAEKYAKESTEARSKRLEEIGEKGLAKTAALKSTLKTLGEGSVLLHYLVTEDRLHIIMTTPNIQLARSSEVKAIELNSKIFALREQLQNEYIDPRPAAKELYSILIAPVEKELKEAGAKTLMLSLDGALRYLPFSALYDGNDYLVINYRTVMYAEVAKDKVVLPAITKWKVAAFGVSKRHSGFDPLPYVPGELAGIVKKGKAGVIPGEIYLDDNFTNTILQDASNRNPVLHIASHFRFSPGTEHDSFLLLGDGSHLTMDQVRNSSYFQNSELLTLSACETAMGSSGRGSEIEGFGALAMNQGAKAVIATLWPVADESTSFLMREFYKKREQTDGALKIEALRQAQLALLMGVIKAEGRTNKKRNEVVSISKAGKSRDKNIPRYMHDPEKPYAHPYFWAPFILIGNWK